jgi:hypothetical protein
MSVWQWEHGHRRPDVSQAKGGQMSVWRREARCQSGEGRPDASLAMETGSGPARQGQHAPWPFSWRVSAWQGILDTQISLYSSTHPSRPGEINKNVSSLHSFPEPARVSASHARLFRCNTEPQSIHIHVAKPGSPVYSLHAPSIAAGRHSYRPHPAAHTHSRSRYAPDSATDH